MLLLLGWNCSPEQLIYNSAPSPLPVQTNTLQFQWWAPHLLLLIAFHQPLVRKLKNFLPQTSQSRFVLTHLNLHFNNTETIAMATGLVDKLHLAFEQVKERNNLGVQFSWQSISLDAQHCCCWCHTDLCGSAFITHCRKGCKYKTPHGWDFWMSSPLPQNFSLPHHPREGPCSTSTLHRQHFKLFLHPLPSPTQFKAMAVHFFLSFLYSLESHAHQKRPWNCSSSYCTEPSVLLWLWSCWQAGPGQVELSTAKKWSLGRQTGLTINELSENRELPQNLGSLRLQDNMQRYSSFLISPPCSVTQNRRYQSQGADHLNIAILVILFSLGC